MRSPLSKTIIIRFNILSRSIFARKGAHLKLFFQFSMMAEYENVKVQGDGFDTANVKDKVSLNSNESFSIEIHIF